MKSRTKRQLALIKDGLIILFSVVIAWLLARAQVTPAVVSHHFWAIADSFVAGLFFVSVFTVVPATVVLVEAARGGPTWPVALSGACGALLGDWLIFYFVSHSLADDFAYFLKLTGFKKIAAIFHYRYSRWLSAVLGALIIASPLPDELGLTLMGLSRLKQRLFVPLVFIVNFLGIWLLLAIFR